MPQGHVVSVAGPAPAGTLAVVDAHDHPAGTPRALPADTLREWLAPDGALLHPVDVEGPA